MLALVPACLFSSSFIRLTISNLAGTLVALSATWNAVRDSNGRPQTLIENSEFSRSIGGEPILRSIGGEPIFCPKFDSRSRGYRATATGLHLVSDTGNTPTGTLVAPSASWAYVRDSNGRPKTLIEDGAFHYARDFFGPR